MEVAAKHNPNTIMRISPPTTIARTRVKSARKITRVASIRIEVARMVAKEANSDSEFRERAGGILTRLTGGLARLG
jgi:hypothetical protein